MASAIRLWLEHASTFGKEIAAMLAWFRAAGTEIEKAGLEGGKLYGVRVVVGGESQEFEIRETWVGTNEARFELQDVGFRENGEPVDVPRADWSANPILECRAHLVTEFLRPEDGA